MMGKLLKVLIATMAMMGFWSLGCGPTYPNCEDDEHCKEKNEVCVDKLCRECRANDNCVAKTGDKCKICSVNYTCVKEPGCCHNDLDCPGGKCWKNEGDEVGRCGGECKTNEHCPPGKECIGERCVVKAADCGGGCPAGKKCQDNVCIWACDFQNVYFDFNESVLTSEARKLMEANVECAKTIGAAISIEGSCDERGTEEYNIALGQRRADRAKGYMQDRGATNSFSTVSYGEEKPVCTESGESCWWRNRRDEFKPRD